MKEEWRKQALQGNTAAMCEGIARAEELWATAVAQGLELGASKKETQGMVAAKTAFHADPADDAEQFFCDGISQCAEEGATSLGSFIGAYRIVFDTLFDEENFDSALRVAFEGFALSELVYGKNNSDAVEWLEGLAEVCLALGEPENAAWFEALAKARRKSINAAKDKNGIAG